MKRFRYGLIWVLLLLCANATTRASNAAVIVVSSTIQAAVNAANPGDEVRIPRGIYHESVLVKKAGITIKGDPGAVLDGTGLGDVAGIRVAADGSTRIDRFELIGTRIRNYGLDGILLKRVDNFQIIGGTFSGNGDYGIFPILSSRGSIEDNQVSGSSDTGIYVGQSSDVEIIHNTSHDNTVGIEVEVSDGITVRNNVVENNALGIISQVLPGLDTFATTNVQISDNIVVANNQPNPFSDPLDLLSELPGGVGILDVAGEHVTISRNTVVDNNSSGIAMVPLLPPLDTADPRVNPLPENNQVRDNIVLFNGLHPDPKLAALGFPAVDLLWAPTGTNNCWAHNIFFSSFPSLLPICH
jgi:parallel beta-helix repeat protein